MIRLIPISPPRSAAGIVRIPLLELHQLPPGVPLDECMKQLKEPA
ncbi:hypothetical protein [Janthinobacterium lividum]|uniref:Uncharacterized protein n=1 Tax=Janthinobacterium lividum TaxID=29581 RepID=A0ABU0XNF0_9BURK|nr:hypothetical protein [Janthinobacterium lividum]MDQ4625049.1 hypothetical protein [Janthinobacterium lividum]MDQ4673348.1 hypothetical protein [Janthinobacterium lividum]MDQ4684078.1 hypothetical protein [Janthinobacterium lividum]